MLVSSFVFLCLFHLIFFWSAHSNPFSMARSELLSTFYPSWIHLGRGEKNDPYFWLNSTAHPVLSSFYPAHWISARIGKRLHPDRGFTLLLHLCLLHFLFGSLGFLLLFNTWTSPLIALFGAVTLTYGAYSIKQQPCLIYTAAWFSWILLGMARCDILLTGVSFGMMLLAGYYPIGIQIALVAGCATVYWNCPPYWIPIGVLIGSFQLIPFLKYLPKTIRTKKVSNIGRVPWWHPITLIFPMRQCLNGVGFWEMAYYVGIVPLVLIASSTSRAWIFAVVSYFLMIGVGRQFLPRIPARWCFLFQFSLGWCAVSGLSNLHLTERVLAGLLLVQAFDLIWHNADLIPTSPYSELPNKPSRAFDTRLTRYLSRLKPDNRISGLPYPLFTGHINRFKTLGYSGGMQLKLMAKWRKDNNSDGSGQHDWFKQNEDNESLDRYRVEFAYTTKRIDWIPTEIKYLYRNPRLASS